MWHSWHDEDGEEEEEEEEEVLAVNGGSGNSPFPGGGFKGQTGWSFLKAITGFSTLTQ